MKKFLSLVLTLLLLFSLGVGQTSKQHQVLISEKISASWVPTDETSLDWWLTADSLVLNDNDAVTNISDSSIAGLNYGNGTAAQQPVYKTGIVNGRPIIR